MSGSAIATALAAFAAGLLVGGWGVHLVFRFVMTEPGQRRAFFETILTKEGVREDMLLALHKTSPRTPCPEHAEGRSAAELRVERSGGAR